MHILRSAQRGENATILCTAESPSRLQPVARRSYKRRAKGKSAIPSWVFRASIVIGLLGGLAAGGAYLIATDHASLANRIVISLFSGVASGVGLGLTALMTLAPLYYLVTVLRSSARYGVAKTTVAYRLRGLSDVRTLALDTAEAAGLPRAIPTVGSREWRDKMLQRLIAHVGIGLAVLAAFGLVFSFALWGDTFNASMGVKLMTPVASAALIVLGGIVGSSGPGSLSSLMKRQLQKTPGLSLEKRPGRGQFSLSLPSGSGCDCTSFPAQIKVRYPCPELRIEAALVEEDTLGDERHDFESGHALLDRATILLGDPQKRRPVTPWLAGDLRSYLLALLSLGAVVRGGGLVFRVPLADNDAYDALLERLVLLNAFAVRYAQMAELTEEQRAIEALRSEDDQVRDRLLGECRETLPSAEAQAILRHWISHGTGRTRGDALLGLIDLAREAGLERMSDAIDAGDAELILATARCDRLTALGPEGLAAIGGTLSTLGLRPLMQGPVGHLAAAVGADALAERLLAAVDEQAGGLALAEPDEDGALSVAEEEGALAVADAPEDVS